jgi:hypothetical protein
VLICYIFPNLECLDQEKSGNPDNLYLPRTEVVKLWKTKRSPFLDCSKETRGCLTCGVTRWVLLKKNRPKCSPTDFLPKWAHYFYRGKKCAHKIGPFPLFKTNTRRKQGDNQGKIRPIWSPANMVGSVTRYIQKNRPKFFIILYFENFSCQK